MAKLYEITEKLRFLENLLDENEEVDQEVLKDTLEAVEMELEEKVENILKFVRELEGDSEKYKAERQRLQKLEQQAARKAEQLKNYVIHELTQAGFDHKNKRKLKTSLGNVSFQKNPATIELVDLEKLQYAFPESYKGLKEENFSKTEITKRLKEFTYEGVSLNDLDEQNIPAFGIKWINNRFHMRVR